MNPKDALVLELAAIGARAIVERWDLERYQEAVAKACASFGMPVRWTEDAVGRPEIEEEQAQ